MTPSATARGLLQPFAVIYGGVARLRAACYARGLLSSRRLPGKVISVGNLTMGGTGKTPMVLWIAERLAAEGHRPAILTRGYRGFGRCDTTLENTADEVALLRQRLKGQAQFGVGKDRYENGLALSKNGAEWFILDDGFQHLELQRDADIVLVDATDAFGGILPAGRLREPCSGLKRADIVVITRSSRAPAVERVVKRFTSAPIFYARTRLDTVVRIPTMEVVPEAQSRQCKFFAFCGIGNPAAFFEDLRTWGFEVLGERKFKDHHRYSNTDLREVVSAATAVSASALICTEKDIFNLPLDLDFRVPAYACRIGLQLNDENGFWTAIRAAIGRHQPVTQT